MTLREKENRGNQEFFRTREEEWANAMSHLAGLVFGIVGLTMMCMFAAQKGTARHVVSCAIYGTTLVLMFNNSMLYHLVWAFRAKAILQKMDHLSIYLLIAGTYTPFALLAMTPVCGWWIFGIIWGLCVIGLITEILCRREWIAVPIYIIMGWLIVMVIKQLYVTMRLPGFVLLVVGGAVYTIGVIFYSMDRVPWMHTVWHVFVLGGAVCHWVAITFFLLP